MCLSKNYFYSCLNADSYMLSLKLKPTHKPIKQYYEELENFNKLGVVHETAVKAAFQKLLESCCQQFKWTLIQEYGIKRPKKQPLRVDWNTRN